MKLHVGGARGSRAVTDPACSTFGGDTTSFLVEGHNGDAIAIDGGSGLVHVCKRLVAAKSAMLLFSHYHMDHLNGLPGCVPALRACDGLRIAGPERDAGAPDQILGRLLNGPYWPVPFEQSALSQITRGLDPYKGSEGIVSGDLRVRWCDVAHPGGSIAYRIDEAGTACGIVIASDVEWSVCSAIQQEALRDLCAGPHPAGLLVMDAQYDDAEYASRTGWGHSTWREAVALAQVSGVGRLAITHHDPAATDEALQAREDTIRAEHAPSALLRQFDVIDV